MRTIDQTVTDDQVLRPVAGSASIETAGDLTETR
jgi:hypothetical protein